MCVNSDYGDSTTYATTDVYVPACESGDMNDASCVSCFVASADNTDNKWNDGTDDWWTFTIFPTTLDGAWDENETWCWAVTTLPSPGDGSTGTYTSASAECHTFGSHADSAPETILLGPEFWMAEDYDFENSNIDHNGMHGSWEYLTQEHRIEDGLAEIPPTDWDVVDFTEHYEAFSAINFPGDNKAKRNDWKKLVHYNFDITNEKNRVINGMTAAEWIVSPFDHDHEPWASLNDTWTASGRRELNSQYLEDEVGQGNCMDEPDCLRMPSVTESIDGGICGMVVWRAYPRMVDSAGDITNRAYEWLEGGFANDEEGRYRLKRGRGCGKAKGHDKAGRDLKGKAFSDNDGKKIGHTKNGGFKGHCPFDNKSGRWDLSARTSREEAPCGEGVDITLGGYQPCATTLDAAAAAGGRRMLEDTEWGGVTVTPTWEGDAVSAIIEECDNDSGDCTSTEVVSGDTYTFNFGGDMTYNFVGQNEYGSAADITMDYSWFAASGASGLAASLVAGATIFASLF